MEEIEQMVLVEIFFFLWKIMDFENLMLNIR
jgi:hypothetical protein